MNALSDTRAKRARTVVLIALGVTLAGYFVMAAKYPVAFVWASYENLIGEWTQFYIFLAATVAAATAARRSDYRWCFVLLTGACFYVAMEEISWGQHVLGFSSPEFFQDNNLQRETNLHNFLVGPIRTTTKTVVEIVLACALIGYGFIYPAMLGFRLRLAVWADRLGVAPPPLYLSPFFVIAGVFELGPLNFHEAEIAELLIAIAVLVVALHHVRFPKGYAGKTAQTLTAALALATVTTLVGYSIPAYRPAMDQHVLNCLARLADKYTDRGHPGLALPIYTRLHDAYPSSSHWLRRLASVHRQLGQRDEYRARAIDALVIDLESHSKRPLSDKTNRELVKTYRLLDQPGLAERHMNTAIKIGESRLAQRPDDAGVHLSLGRSLELADDWVTALQMYEKAYELDDTSMSIRAAYFDLKKRMTQTSPEQGNYTARLTD